MTKWSGTHSCGIDLLYQLLMTDKYDTLVERQQWITKKCLTLVICREMSGPYTVFSVELKNYLHYVNHLKL